MLRPGVYPGQVWDRPRCLQDAGDEDPPQFRSKITPGGGAKVSLFMLFKAFEESMEPGTQFIGGCLAIELEFGHSSRCRISIVILLAEVGDSA